jgi:hypothetical protein
MCHEMDPAASVRLPGCSNDQAVLYVRPLSPPGGQGVGGTSAWFTTEAWAGVAGFEWGADRVLYTLTADDMLRPYQVRG